MQNDLIGKHPSANLGTWLSSEDLECTETKRHRYLEINTDNVDSINITSQWLVKYHLSERKKRQIKNKKEILEKYDFNNFISEVTVFPNSDKTRKGNLGEVILSEYLSLTTEVEVLVYKLHYNPNIDQSMKGDDVLLVNEEKIIVGESKFRSNPSKSAVEAAAEMRDKLTFPLSLDFISNILYEQGQYELSDMISDLQFDLTNKDINIMNIGFLMSTKEVKRFVEKNLVSNNPNFIFISIGVDNPNSFLESAFGRAQEIILKGDL